MSNCHRSYFNGMPFSVPCPTPSTVSIPFPTPFPCPRLGSGFLVAQDGAIPQAIPVVAIGGDPVTTAINFNTALPGDETGITAATVIPPGIGGGGNLNSLVVSKAGLYDINAGLSVIGLLATIPAGSGIIAQIIKVTPDNTRVPLSPISFLGPFSALAGIIPVLGLARGTVQLQDVPLAVGDAVQIQLFIPAVGISVGVLAVSYAFLEVASQ